MPYLRLAICALGTFAARTAMAIEVTAPKIDYVGPWWLSPWLLLPVAGSTLALAGLFWLHQRSLRRELQRELDKARQLAQQMLDALPQGALLLDANFGIQASNAAITALWPLAPQRLGQPFLELVSDWLSGQKLDPTEQTSLFASLSRTDNHQFELRLPDGRFWLFEQYALPGGQFLRLQTDISRSYQEERRLRQVWNASLAGCAVLMDDQLIDANDSFVRLMGASSLHRLHGLSLAQLGQPEGNTAASDRFDVFMNQLVQEGRVIQDWLLNRQDKNWQPVELQASCIELDHRPAILLVVVDLRLRKQNELSILESRRQAEQAAASKTVFLATMSHEIRTPMTGVLGLLEILEHSRLDLEQRQNIKMIQESAQSLLQVINDVLDFSRIEAGKMLLEATPVSILSILENIMQLFARQARQKHLGFHLFVDPRIAPQLLADGGRLRQILFNLLSNALKFTEAGAVRLEARLLREENSVQFIEFQVIDSGIGIHEAQQSQLFEPFVQADSSTNRRFGGTGLGLSICKRLAELMSADISLRSRLQIGTTLSLRIPLPIVTPHVEPYLNLNGLQVLLAVDQERHAALIKVWLEYCGALVQLVSPPLGDETAQLTFLRQQLGQSSCSLIVVTNRAAADAEYYSKLVELGESGHWLILLLGRPDEGSVQVDERDYLLYCSAQPILPSELLEMLALALGQSSQQEMALPNLPVSSTEQASQLGQLILVAEDHPTSQRVILRQLNLLGYAAEVFADGAQALAAWKTGRYGLILTDCTMPVMDGYELTRAIRSQEGAGERIPILALTANALSWDSAKCLGAGMDDYLSKPAGLKVLSAKLQHWLPRLPAPPLLPIEVMPISHPQPLVLSTLQQLFSEPADIREMLEDFLHSTQQDIELAEQALLQQQADEVARIMHKTKGASRIIGAVPFAESCRLFELAVVEQDWPQLQQEWQRFAQQWQKLIQAIKKVLNDAN